MTVEEISLHFQQGASDKVYHVQIETAGAGGYVVNFQYGRRGSTLQSGTKTTSPVTLQAAQGVFGKLVREKQNKGYQVTNSVTPIRHSAASVGGGAAAATAPEIEVQLLNAVEETQLETLFRNPNVGAQEKYDGNRMVLRKKNGEAVAFNRRGLRVSLPQAIADAFLSLETDELEFDGEIIGECFYAFDCLNVGGRDLRSEAFLERAINLSRVLTTQPFLIRAPLEVTENGKRALFERLQREKKEGIVFRELKASYSAGRPASGGSALKFKFYAEATCRVKKVNENRRSIALEVLGNDGKYQDIGNCTVPVNHPIPAAGSLCEIRYLYAYPAGSLYQPVFKAVRTDKAEADLYDSLKFKTTATDDGDE